MPNFFVVGKLFCQQYSITYFNTNVHLYDYFSPLQVSSGAIPFISNAGSFYYVIISFFYYFVQPYIASLGLPCDCNDINILLTLFLFLSLFFSMAFFAPHLRRSLDLSKFLFITAIAMSLLFFRKMPSIGVVSCPLYVPIF